MRLMVIKQFDLIDWLLMPQCGCDSSLYRLFMKGTDPVFLLVRKKSWLFYILFIFPLHAVLSVLHQKKVIVQHDLQKRRGNAQELLLYIILDQCTKPSEDVTTTADVLDTFGCKKEADMLRCTLGLC